MLVPFRWTHLYMRTSWPLWSARWTIVGCRDKERVTTPSTVMTLLLASEAKDPRRGQSSYCASLAARVHLFHPPPPSNISSRVPVRPSLPPGGIILSIGALPDLVLHALCSPSRGGEYRVRECLVRLIDGCVPSIDAAGLVNVYGAHLLIRPFRCTLALRVLLVVREESDLQI